MSCYQQNDGDYAYLSLTLKEGEKYDRPPTGGVGDLLEGRICVVGYAAQVTGLVGSASNEAMRP